MNHISLADTARKHAIHLAKTIGPRLAGSSAEKQAFEYISEQLSAQGYQLQRSSAPFAPSPSIHYPSIIGALALAICGWALSRNPWVTLGLPFLIAALPQWTIRASRNRKPTAETENVFAWLNHADTEFAESNDPYASLILCAHVDSARALPFRSKFFLRLHSRSMDIIQRVAIVLALLGILQLLGVSLPPGLLAACGAIAVVTTLFWLFMQLWGFWRSDLSPGAVDNASGVGVLLALAEYYATTPIDRPRLGFLFTGAEETGAHGASAFAASLHAEEKQSAFLVLDMVGAGNVLRYVVADGVYYPLRTDPLLNQMLRKACPHARPMNETLRSGDHAIFIRHGFPTAALQTSGSSRAELAYHTVHDRIDLLDTKTLEMTIQCVINLCALQDE